MLLVKAINNQRRGRVPVQPDTAAPPRRSASPKGPRGLSRQAAEGRSLRRRAWASSRTTERGPSVCVGPIAFASARSSARADTSHYSNRSRSETRRITARNARLGRWSSSGLSGRPESAFTRPIPLRAVFARTSCTWPAHFRCHANCSAAGIGLLGIERWGEEWVGRFRKRIVLYPLRLRVGSTGRATREQRAAQHRGFRGGCGMPVGGARALQRFDA